MQTSCPIEALAPADPMPPLPVIGLMGALGSGKTTVAKHIAATRGYLRLRMADPLKDMLLALGLTRAQVDGDEKETPSPILGGRTPRFAMQTIGTEWGRQIIHPDIWVNAMAHKIGHLGVLPPADPRRPNGVVIDDIRFPNEVAMVERLGGLLAVIRRKSAESDPFKPAHPSETFWRGVAAIHRVPEIHNEGDIQALLAAAERVLW